MEEPSRSSMGTTSHALAGDDTPVGPAGQQVFMHYVIWGLKHLLAETDYYRDFLVWDDQDRSWRLPFAFLPATDVSPPVIFSCTWRKSDQGWKTSATPPYSNLIRDVRSRRPDNEVLHIQLHASDLAMLPFRTRLIWLLPFPARVVLASSLVSRNTSRALCEFRDLEEASECEHSIVFHYRAPCWFDVVFIDFCTEYLIGTTYSIMCTGIDTSGRGRD